jgi:phosphate starvation-inducible protein PhoH
VLIIENNGGLTLTVYLVQVLGSSDHRVSQLETLFKLTLNRRNHYSGIDGYKHYDGRARHSEDQLNRLQNLGCRQALIERDGEMNYHLGFFATNYTNN